MSESQPTRVNAILNWMHNNKILSVVIVGGLFIIGLGAVTGSLTDIGEFFFGTTTPPEIEVVKITVTEDFEKYETVTEDFEKYGHSFYGHSFWPALDYRVKNVGGETGLITDLALEVIKAEVNTTPRLYFQLIPTETGDIQLRVVNLGWGPALDVELQFLQGPIREVLSSDQLDFSWKGSIEDHVIITIPATSIDAETKREFTSDQLSGTVKYHDVSGKLHTSEIKYDSVPRYRGLDWKIVVTPEHFEIETIDHGIRFGLLVPSAVYDAFLEPKKVPFKISVPVSQALAPGEPDRFLVVIASSKSANYVVRSHLEIDGKNVITTEPVDISIDFPRLLPSFFYRDGLSIEMKHADPFSEMDVHKAK
ncbi:hypothetical protein MYX75_03905 [Acidobacteria bacterium AH-259-A15]|nr:hypothetical protein [Acidobacteria bacterium AH-259-A15]